MADTSNSPALISMAQQFTGLPMGSLIGGPLMAAAHANQKMALTQVKFMMSTCFTTPKDKNTYTPIMVDMEMTRGVISPPSGTQTEPTIQQITSTISIPLLTLIPLNSLAVDNVHVNFVMNVSSSYSQDHSDDSHTASHEAGTLNATLGEGLWSVHITGSVSHDSSHDSTNSSHYAKNNSATYTVGVHAGQLPLPPGVTTIIDAFTSNISPITMPTPAPTPGKK